MAIDATGLCALEDLLDKAHADGTVPDFRRALERAKSILAGPV
jgi:hypothetical protein